MKVSVPPFIKRKLKIPRWVDEPPGLERPLPHPTPPHPTLPHNPTLVQWSHCPPPSSQVPNRVPPETEEATEGGTVMAPLGWAAGPTLQAPPTRTGPEGGSAGGEGLNPGVGGLVSGGGAWRVRRLESTRKKVSSGGAGPQARKANWPLQPGVDQRQTGPRGSDTRGQRRQLPAQGPEPDWTPGFCVPSPSCPGTRLGGEAVGRS